MRLFFLPILILLGLTVSFGQSSVRVVAERANIRTAPSAKAAVIATVKQDESLELVESRGVWYKVKTGDRVGWVHGNSVQQVFALAAPRPYVDINPRYGDPHQRLGTGLGTGPGTGTGRGQGAGTGSGTGTGTGTVPQIDRAQTNTSYATDIGSEKVPSNAPIKFLSKPKASYTEIARKNQVQGTIRLRVTFLASGQVGLIRPINSLPDGLTEKAVEAAQQIRFVPQQVNGMPRTVVKIIEYSFYIY